MNNLGTLLTALSMRRMLIRVLTTRMLTNGSILPLTY